ncbi:hypothetical protein H5T57_04905 [Candidatus Bipolaricaulota bacterium]|nr:hypothetical protein [Candidatus Bipolaricaulota bacterium]
MQKAVTSTAVIAILVLLGFFSRRWHILREGDERVLNTFVYYFAFPAFTILRFQLSSFLSYPKRVSTWKRCAFLWLEPDR